jgi:hypothetical protein
MHDLVYRIAWGTHLFVLVVRLVTHHLHPAHTQSESGEDWEAS